MNKTSKFSPEVRERVVRLVQEHWSDYPSLWAAVASIAPKIGCVAHNLLAWIKREEADTGTPDRLTNNERGRLSRSNARTRSCAGPTTSSQRPARISPRRSSTVVLRFLRYYVFQGSGLMLPDAPLAGPPASVADTVPKRRNRGWSAGADGYKTPQCTRRPWPSSPRGSRSACRKPAQA
jgi:transposase